MSLESRLVGVLPHVRGDTRTQIVAGLSILATEQSRAVLEAIAADTALPVFDRVQGVRGYARVAGADATPLLEILLGERSFELQLAAMCGLAWHGTIAAADHVVAWSQKRLRGRGKRKVWDFAELPAVILYCHRHSMLDRIIPLVLRYYPEFPSEEKSAFDQHWPHERMIEFQCGRGLAPGSEVFENWLRSSGGAETDLGDVDQAYLENLELLVGKVEVKRGSS